MIRHILFALLIILFSKPPNPLIPSEWYLGFIKTSNSPVPLKQFFLNQSKEFDSDLTVFVLVDKIPQNAHILFSLRTHILLILTSYY